MYMDPVQFWGVVLALVAVFIAGYFILRQALLDAMEEHSKRERERDERARRGGTR